jgi:hypothetical protein
MKMKILRTDHDKQCSKMLQCSKPLILSNQMQHVIQTLQSVSSAMLKYAEGEAGREERKTDENNEDDDE